MRRTNLDRHVEGGLAKVSGEVDLATSIEEDVEDRLVLDADRLVDWGRVGAAKVGVGLLRKKVLHHVHVLVVNCQEKRSDPLSCDEGRGMGGRRAAP